jgi:hypothetical protein
MNISSISLILVVVVGLLPALLVLTEETTLFNENSNNLINIDIQFAYAQQEEEYGNAQQRVYDIKDLFLSVIKSNNNDDSSNISQQQNNEQQKGEQQNKQEISIIRTDDYTCETTINEKIELNGTIIEPEEKLLIADFIPCKISDGKVIFNIPNPNLRLGIPFTDYTDYEYGYVNDNSHSIETALLTPIEFHGKDTGLFAIELHDGQKSKDKETGEKTTFTNINELYLHNSGDEPLEFKSGDIVVIRATLDK